MKQVVGMTLKVLVAISAASVAGFKPLLCCFTRCSWFRCGAGISGSLSNFAVCLASCLKTYKVGDFIEGGSAKGTVQEIGIVYTTLTTPDNKVITVPNGSLANSTITNFSTKDTRRVDFVFGTSYDVPVSQAKAAIESVVSSHELILKDPAWTIRLGAHNSSSLDYTVRVWVKAEDYWTVHFDLMEAIKMKFDEEDIEIPYNKVDVNLFSQEKSS